MGLMIRARRRLVLAALMLLAAPALLMPFTPPRAVSVLENRVLASAPAWPRSGAQALALPRAIDAFVADHFVARQSAIYAAMRVQKKLGGHAGAPEAVQGRRGWLFLSDGLLQSTGQVRQPEQAGDYAAFVCAVQGRLRARGMPVVFTLIPSPGEIYPEQAPDWAGPAMRPTDYDTVLAGVRACGVTAVDLRPAMLAARAQGRLYRTTDSHWTPRGALTGYDALVEAMGRPDWRHDPAAMRWTMVQRRDGDLPRLAGEETRAEPVDTHDRVLLPASARKATLPGLTWTQGAPFGVETGHAGPTVLVIGDSFTGDPFPPLFEPFVGRVVWVHQDDCAFDWRVFDRVKPDYVVMAASEREARCRRGRPLNVPR